MPVELTISKSYLNREQAKGHDVEDWIRSYAKRNHVTCEDITDMSRRRFASDPGVPELKLVFRSEHQLGYFLRKGRWMFPHFEFL